MSIKIFSEEDKEEWNSIVDHSIPCSPFHRWEWLRLAEKHSNMTLHPIVYLDKSGNPLCALPLFYSKKGLLKTVFSPPPGCGTRLGPVFTDVQYKTKHGREKVYKEFVDEINEYANNLGANYIRIITNPGLMDVRPFLWSGYDATPMYTYKLDLTKGEEAVLAGMGRRLRKNIRRTQEAGVIVVEETTEGAIDSLHSLLDERYKEKNLRLDMSKEYLYDLIDKSTQLNFKVFTAYYHDDFAGAVIHVNHKYKSSAWVGSCKPSVKGLEIISAVHWEAIRWAIQGGYHEYEMVGANTPSVCEYKSKFSPDVDTYFTLVKAGAYGRLAERAFLLFKNHRYWRRL